MVLTTFKVLLLIVSNIQFQIQTCETKIKMGKKVGARTNKTQCLCFRLILQYCSGAAPLVENEQGNNNILQRLLLTSTACTRDGILSAVDKKDCLTLFFLMRIDSNSPVEL